MQLRSFLLLFILAIPLFSNAQPDITPFKKGHFTAVIGQDEKSNLSVFSVNGEQFFLVLNGINQNSIPTSRIRVEGLPQYANDIEIIFADGRSPAIRKRIIVADQVAGYAVDMTLKILSGMEQYPVLRFHKCTEVEHDYHAQRDEYVMYYGKLGQTNTVTTTTTYEQNTPPTPAAMDQQTFNEVKQSIANASFDDTKLSTAKTILSSNYVTTDQVMEICKLFSFENTKLAFAEYAYSRNVDPNNYFKVGSILDFDADKKALNDFISKNHR
ncbi:MAG: DUF4476 domain-containing protein [Chitinophagales bacterium]